MGKDQQVIPHNGKWAVKGVGNKKVTSTHSSKADAINAARRIARNQKSKVIIDNYPFYRVGLLDKQLLIIIIVVILIAGATMNYLSENYCTSSLESGPIALFNGWLHGKLIPIK